MKITSNIKLDFAKPSSNITVYAKQGDSDTRYIDITPVLNGAVWDIPAGVKAYFAASKPDGKRVINEQTIEDGHIVVYLTDQTLVASGKAVCSIILVDSNNDVLSTHNFNLNIEYSPGVYAALESTDEVQTLWGLIESIKTKLANGDFNGSPGKDGKSAYESALDGGYDGTEEEFNEDLANAGKNGGADLSDAVPLMNGEASAGVAETAARADHVHPTDTSRMPAISKMGILMTPTGSDRFPVYDYDESVMKYTSWARILSLLLSEIDKVPEADLATVATGLLAPGTIDVYATLPEGMTEDGVIALVSDIAAALKNYYTAEEVDGLVSAIPKFSIEVVTKLPSENISSTTVYLVVSEGDEENLYAEYIRVNGKWEKLGEQKVDLTGYATEKYVEDYAQPKGEYLPADQLAPAVNDALAQAKASGEFDGKDGADGSRWFSGTQVSIDGGYPVNLVTGAKEGDYYLNTFTGNVYIAGSSVWAYEGNIKGADGVGISGASINANGQLVVSYTDGTSATLGKVVGADGKDGADGYTPVKGVDYFDGEPGYTPVKGVDYFDGKDGVSPTVATSKSGKVTTVTITDKNGQKTAAINDGVDGSSVTVSSVSESSADGGTNVVTFSDGKTLTVKNGSKGKDGDDYVLTEDDKSEIAELVEENAKGDIVQSIIEELQGLPVFGVVDGNNVITVTSQLTDGTYILKYEYSDGTLEEIGTIIVGTGTGGGDVIINLADPTSAEWKTNKRINSSKNEVDIPESSLNGETMVITNLIDITDATNATNFHFKGLNLLATTGVGASYNRIYFYDESKAYKWYWQPSGNYVSNYVNVSDYDENVQIFANVRQLISSISELSGITVKYIAFGAVLTGTAEDVVITKDAQIQ